MSRPWLSSSLNRIGRGRIRPLLIARQTGKSRFSAVMQGYQPDRNPALWSYWRTSITLFPRKSVYGKWIIGKVYRRSRSASKWHSMGNGGYLQREYIEKQFFSKKEMFRWKLENKGE